MALFNLTAKKIDNTPEEPRSFRVSNSNIRISVRDPLRISEVEITEQEWLGNF